MLSTLTIKNYTLIDSLKVEFNKGLSIITGETGAGKSILLGGLSLALGKRADLSSIKNQHQKCIIEAVFNIADYKLKSFFKKQDLDYEDQTIVRREILPSGKSRAFINDTPVKLENLQALGEQLLDIHSQHQTLKLTNEDFQFKVIDALADNNTVLKNYAKNLKHYNILKEELKKLQQSRSEAVKAYDYNSFLLKELDEARLIDGELETLEKEHDTLNNIEEIQENLSASHLLLNNDPVGTLNTLTEVKGQLSKLSSYAPEYHDIYNRVDSSLIELNDIFSEIESLQENLETDPHRLDSVNHRLQLVNNLLQKHSVSAISELIAIKEDLRNKVATTENIEDSLLQKEKDLESVIKQLDKEAALIHRNRASAIPKFTSQLETLLSSLGMPNAQFKIDLIPKDTFLPKGKESISFLFSANKGTPFNDLKKAASGGELSRIMLAIKYILSKYMQLPTIIFDEIDTGVSGEISNKMGYIMQQMSKTMQVFSITHLPQIAAKGSTHFKVFKEDIENKTQTNLKKLSSQERVLEIAQMLDGAQVSESALAHAKQLLN